MLQDKVRRFLFRVFVANFFRKIIRRCIYGRAKEQNFVLDPVSFYSLFISYLERRRDRLCIRVIPLLQPPITERKTVFVLGGKCNETSFRC